MLALLERILLHTQPTAHGCLEWTRPVTPAGYGQLNVGGKPRQVHRLLYELLKGVILNGDLCVLHKCDNRRCVNIEHLYLGTKADNSADMVSKGRQQHGETHKLAVLSDDQVDKIRSSAGTNSSIARLYGVNPSTISRIKSRKRRRHRAGLYV